MYLNFQNFNKYILYSRCVPVDHIIKKHPYGSDMASIGNNYKSYKFNTVQGWIKRVLVLAQ